MSIETTCKNCGAEYDVRHGKCPACTVNVNVRSRNAPYETWPAIGYLPFKVYGELFAVTQRTPVINDQYQWIVSHVALGVGLPEAQCATKEEARDKAKAHLAEVGRKKLMAALAKVRTLIASKPSHPEVRYA